MLDFHVLWIIIDDLSIFSNPHAANAVLLLLVAVDTILLDANAALLVAHDANVEARAYAAAVFVCWFCIRYRF